VSPSAQLPLYPNQRNEGFPSAHVPIQRLVRYLLYAAGIVGFLVVLSVTGDNVIARR